MAEEGSGGGERSQDPTARRLEKAREEGNVAQSREVQMLIVLASFLVFFLIFSGDAVKQFVIRMETIMGHFADISPDMGSVYVAMHSAQEACLKITVPFAFVGTVATLIIGFLQTSFLFRPEAIKPDLSRLSPLKGIKRIFGITNLVEMAKSVTKLVMFCLVLYGVALGTLKVSHEAERWTAERLVREMSSWFIYATLIVLIVQCCIAVLDDVWTRYHRFSQLKMSFQDIKEEYRQTEGDPHVKGRLKAIRLSRSRQRMIQNVKKAAVVITNPTHYAVALKYDSETDSAPQIIAKGVDELAARIRTAAEDARVPVVANPPLARALHALPLESEIPPEYFQPVATIIAYVMKLKTPGSRAQGHQ
ncbi:MAG: EscU/YscU/HrcU family type III secretion system export apparatus switch protein [Acetobacter sp.]|nr:EscU/YscU/HrcU family type III secretion system export apparatus switch protein [Acetobacter sp.]